MRFVSELRELGSFLLSLWGVLTLLSAFLPFMNQISRVLPMPESQANMATGLASLTCLFAFLYAFAERHRLHASAFRPSVAGFGGFDPDSSALRSALERFGMALALLAFYMIMLIFRDRLAADRTDTPQLIVAILSPLLLIGYAALFGLLTAAFGELAVIEHVRGRESDEARALIGLETRRP